MTETLQQKIDAIFDNWYADELKEAIPSINKALQEFREQIKELGSLEAVTAGGETFYWIRMHSVLDLIGEKHE